MNRIPTLLLLLLFSLPLLAQGYKVVRPDGSVEFTDRPPESGNATEIPLRSIQTVDTPDRPSGKVRNQDDEQDQKDTFPGYDWVRIVSPGNEQTIRTNTWQVTGSFDTAPDLQPNHRVAIFLDGKEMRRTRTKRFVFSPVYRGTHTLSAKVVDGQGNVLKSSDSVTFYVHSH